MKRNQIVSILTAIFIFLGFGVVFAEPVIWSGNGHYYDVVEDATNMSWEDAKNWASELTFTDASGQLFKGYLATITSSQEADFIASLSFTKKNYLLGGYQTPTTRERTNAEKKADWHWVTGEEWSYTNWRSGEPNNFFRWVGVVGAGRSEEYLQYFPASSSGSWNDVYTGTFTDNNGEHFFGMRNFIVEYEALTSSNIFTIGSATFDLSTYIIHVPCVTVGMNYYWVDLQIATVEPLTIKIIGFGNATGNIGCSTLDLSTQILYVSRLFLNGRSYDLSLQWNSSGFFTLTGIEDTGSSYGDDGECFVACKNQGIGVPLDCAVSCDSLFGGVYALAVSDYVNVRLGPTSWNACANLMRALDQPGW